MEGMNGIEVAQRVRKRSARCLIVFLTSSKEYAFDAFPVHPFDYLVKPYSAARLDHVLSGAIRLMEESEQLVEIHLPRQTIRLPHGQIVAVTSHGHALDIFTVSGACLKSSQTFAELEAALRGDERFLPCNRGVLVNMDEALKLEHEPAKDWIRGVEDMHTAAQMMVMRAHHGDVIFTVGAGDITQMDEVILHALEAHRWDCEG